MKTTYVALGSAGLLVLAATVYATTNGALPGTISTELTVVANTVARSTGCGQCHTGPAPSTVVVEVNPGVRTFPTDQTISMNTKALGGTMEPGKETWGGFINEVTDGAFTAGTSSQTDPSNLFITHKFSFFGGRDWSYTYKSPSTPGVIELYAAANTVNGDGLKENDMWGFHGDPSGQVSVPVRLYANATGHVHHGDGCVGSFGNYPVLGSKETPNIGNVNFAYEIHGAPVSALGVMFLGNNPNFHVPLDLIGINGCTLHVQSLATIPFGTSAAGTTMRADGTSTIAFPLPNLPVLQGATIQAQGVLIDIFVTGRSIALTLTNALATTFL